MKYVFPVVMSGLVMATLYGVVIASKPPVNSIIEELDDGVQVTGWNAQGLLLEDGRTLPLPGILELPVHSRMLPSMIGRGVEITWTGRVIGLIDIRHWLPRDPIRRHIARVDIARVLQFTGEVPGDYGVAIGAKGPIFDDIDDRGWNGQCYQFFQDWSARTSNRW
jgi:hypothetical protein